MKDLISHQLVSYLEDRGVEHMFGLCGHTNIAVLTALTNSSIKFVNIRHEQIAAHAADGYARVRRKASLGAAQPPRPGPDQRRHRRRQRRARFHPDGGDRRRHPQPLLRQAPAPGDQPACGRRAVRDLPPVREARLARRPRPTCSPRSWRRRSSWPRAAGPGPVLVSVPMDIFSMEIDTELFDRVQAAHHACWSSRRSTTRPPSGSSLTLADAQRPVIYVGGGVLLAGRRARSCAEFVDHMGIPVAHSLMGKGVLPDDHPDDPGHDRLLGHQVHQRQLPHRRLGARPGHQLQGGGLQLVGGRIHLRHSRPTKLIHIDIDPNEIGRNYPVEIGVVADLKQALTVLNRVARQLYPAGPRQRRPARRDRRVPRRVHGRQRRGRSVSEQFPMRPERILADVRERAAARRDHHHRRGLEQERRRPAVPDHDAGLGPHPRRLRDHGLRRAGGHGRQDRRARPGGGLAGRRRRLRPEPGRCWPRPSRRTSP